MKGLVTLIAVVGSGLCQAQYMPLGPITQWTDGYVITMQNDTLQGRVRIGSMINDSPANVVLETADGQKRKLKGADLRVVAQRLPGFAYLTGSIPRDREMIVFERVVSPRQGARSVLLERLTPFGGRVALYFDPFGWKKTSEYTFGNFTVGTNPRDLSYVVLKNGTASLLATRGEFGVIHETVFGDCPAFIRAYPVASRRDWNQFGDMVKAYNQLCP